MSRKSIIFTSIAVFFVVFLSIFLFVNHNPKENKPTEDNTPKAKINFVVDNNVTSTIETAGKEELVLPVPTKDGYAFIGWYTDNETFVNEFKSNSLVETELKEDMSVYSKWIAVFTLDESTVTGLSDYAKENLTKIVIPDSIDGVEITAIENKAFFKNTKLTSIVIGNNVETIGNNAFYNCSSLNSLVLGSKVSSIGKNAIQGCTSLNTLVVAAGNETFRSTDSLGNECNVIIDIEAGAVLQGSLKSVIPTDEDVTSISEFAFYNFARLTEIKIGSNIKTIGMNAFANCSSLTSIVISENVSEISYFAFDGCTALSEVVIESSLIYEELIDSSDFICGDLIGNVSVVKVLATIVDNDEYTNDYLNDDELYTKTLEEDYYIYTKVVEEV